MPILSKSISEGENSQPEGHINLHKGRQVPGYFKKKKGACGWRRGKEGAMGGSRCQGSNRGHIIMYGFPILPGTLWPQLGAPSRPDAENL